MALCCFKKSKSLRFDHTVEHEGSLTPKIREMRAPTFLHNVAEISPQPQQQQQQQPAISAQDRNSFFVITTIFNPATYQKRYDLYHQFSQHMKDTGAQLVTIECIFPSLNQHDFQVTQANNPLHIQLTSDSIYWMKENLINIAVQRLPPSAKWVAWLDADIYFHEPKGQSWIDMTIAELQKYTIVQIFKKAKFLGPNAQVLRTDYSFGYSVVHQKPIDQARYKEWYPHPGYGWAMAKSTFSKIGGLPDYDIVGSGDLHFAFSLLNKVSNALEVGLNEQFKQMIVQRSNATFQKLWALSKANSKSLVGYVPIIISHFWHGSRKNRQYVGRWKILIHHQFNYLRDMKKNLDGLLKIVHVNKAQFQADILAHFQRRCEDDLEMHEEDEENLLLVLNKRRQKKARKDALAVGQAEAGHKFDRDFDRNTALAVVAGAGLMYPYQNNPPEFPDIPSVDYDDDNLGHGSSFCPKPDYDGHTSDHCEISDHGGHYSDQCGQDQVRDSDQVVAIGASDYSNDYNGTVTCTSQY